MKISEVKVQLIREDKLKAFVSLVIDDSFVVKDIKVISGTNGLFIAMPSKKRKDGQFQDIFHPVNQESRQKLEEVIFEAYKAQVSSSS